MKKKKKQERNPEMWFNSQAEIRLIHTACLCRSKKNKEKKKNKLLSKQRRSSWYVPLRLVRGSESGQNKLREKKRKSPPHRTSDASRFLPSLLLYLPPLIFFSLPALPLPPPPSASSLSACQDTLSSYGSSVH